jgi:hypothetical protein
MSGFLTTSAGLGEEGGEGQGYEDPFAANPFRLPTEKEVFQMTKEAKQNKIEERERQKHLSVQDKTTNNRVVSQIQLSRGHLTGGKKSGTAAGKAFKANADQHPRERETVAEFLAKKKEMFLLSLSLDTKWAEIQKLEERALWREEALAKSDKMLLEDSARFERFLRENDQKAIDASRKAEKESRLKQEKVKEIKRLTALIEAMKNELAKVEDHYNKCKGFKKFLDGLTPRDWIIQQRKALGVAEPNGNLDGMLEDGLAMYFTDPRQLLEQFESLEENNLFLIQQSQETEEALEKVKQQFQQTKLKLDAELNMLNMQIEHLKAPPTPPHPHTQPYALSPHTAPRTLAGGDWGGEAEDSQAAGRRARPDAQAQKGREGGHHAVRGGRRLRDPGDVPCAAVRRGRGQVCRPDPDAHQHREAAGDLHAQDGRAADGAAEGGGARQEP